jgi:uncharacterized membrane protein
VIALASLALATIAFVGSHFLMSHPLRLRLVRSLGERGFTLVYSVVAALTLLWMILAWRSINSSVPHWSAPEGVWWAASVLMLLALILLVGSVVRNPAFPNPGGKPVVRPASGVFAITRHPMNWSFALWAIAHLAVWGSARNIIVAVGILILAIGGSIGQDRKKLRVVGESWRTWQDQTSFMPFGALLSGRASWRKAAPGWIAFGGGLLLWLLVTWFHAPSASLAALVD